MSRAWMPLYVADYLADTGHLTNAEHGAYLMLIMHYWQRGGLPNDDERLASIAKAKLEQWLSMKATIAEFFDDDWRHARIDAELEKSRIAYEKRALAGSKGGSSRKQCSSNATSNAEAMLKQSQSQSYIDTNVSIVASENPKLEKQNSKKTRVSYPEDFETFWKAYPTDPLMAKKTALAQWKALDDDDRSKAIASVPAFRAYCAGKPDYRPVHACRYLSEKRFEGFAQTAERIATAGLIPVSQNSQAGRLWDEYSRATKGKGVPWTNGVWRFPSEYPPETRAAE